MGRGRQAITRCKIYQRAADARSGQGSGRHRLYNGKITARSATRRPFLAADEIDYLEHDPEKACPRAVTRGWEPVFGKDHAQTKRLQSDPIQLKRIRL